MKYKIFVSGVQKELTEERRAVKEIVHENILLREHFHVFLFEDHPAQGRAASKVYLDQATKSDIYIGIFGNKYGDKGSDGLSASEREFRTAQDKSKEILIFIKGKEDSKRDSSLRKLITEIKKPDKGYKYRRFEDIAELKTSMFESLVRFLVDKHIISKTGELPSQLTVESLKRPHSSYPHNPSLAEPLYLANYIQKTGFGTYDMVRQCRSYGLPEPEFIQERGQFTTKIWRNIFTDSYIAKLGLNERQIKAVKYVKEKGKITNEEYQRINGVRRRIASYDLTDLFKKNIFTRIGKVGKGTHYQLRTAAKG